MSLYVSVKEILSFLKTTKYTIQFEGETNLVIQGF